MNSLCTSAVNLIKKMPIFVQIIERIELLSLDLIRIKIVDIKNGKHLWVNADHGRDFHPLTDHMTKL